MAAPLAARLAAPPDSINTLATRSNLSSADQALIREYAEFWTDSLIAAAESPGGVRDIRRELVEPVRRGGVTEVFRTTYGRALSAGLEKAVNEGNAHISVTGVIVLTQVGTDKALELLVDRTSVTREPERPHVRLAAARGCGQLLQSATADMITSKDIVSAARGLRAAAEQEPDCFALRHQVEAIRVASETIPEAGSAQIRGILIETLESTAKRAAAQNGGDPVKMLGAVYPAINKVRLSFLQLPLSAQRDYGKGLAPALEKLLQVAETRWNDLQENDASREQLGRIIFLCERSLTTVDTIIRGEGTPETRLKKAWDDGDADRYSAELSRWRAVLGKPPY